MLKIENISYFKQIFVAKKCQLFWTEGLLFLDGTKEKFLAFEESKQLQFQLKIYL